MSTENIDHFKKWESDLADIDMPEMPKDPIDEIVEMSVDPIQCAININSLIDKNSEEARSLLVRRGISKIGYKHYGAFLNSQVAVMASNAFGLPETDDRLRKRDVHEASQYEGHIFAMGRLATFLAIRYTNVEAGVDQTALSLRITEPYLLSDDGEVNETIALPDYLVFPVSSVLKYKFK